ncbi:MAG: hypothetical protein KC503_27880 [Myxococcales bacterium]|nr:hypothetical protein [Myxococcales bacterium]
MSRVVSFHPVWALALLTLGCQANLPSQRNVPFDAIKPGPYAGYAICIPARTACDRTADASCGGSVVVGPEDGVGVSLRDCGTLDLTWRGTIITNPTAAREDPDIAVYLAAPLPSGVSILVEGSADGENYVIIGALGTFPGFAQRCSPKVVGNEIQIDASNCNHIANVNWVRFSEKTPGTSDVIIDAVKALSFRQPL